MIKYLNIEFSEFNLDNILNTLEENGVETDECFAHDEYDKNKKLLIDIQTAQKIIDSEYNKLKKIIKTIMILENGGFDVVEWFVVGAWRNENWQKIFNNEYIQPRNQILSESKEFKNLIVSKGIKE